MCFCVAHPEEQTVCLNRSVNLVNNTSIQSEGSREPLNLRKTMPLSLNFLPQVRYFVLVLV